MIEGGGLGSFEPDEVGPIDVQHGNGVVDLRVADDRAAVAAARRYLSYFREAPGVVGAHDAEGAFHPGAPPSVADQAGLREMIPEQRKRVYEVRPIVRALFDEGSVLELRDGFAPGMLTALARLDGRPLGVVANDPTHLGGAIDADGADKAARFMQLCDAFGLPLLFLCDTPGFMAGSAPRRWRQAASRRRSSRSRGRRRSSGRWAWRARCAWACAASWRRSRTRASARRLSSAWSGSPTSADAA
jgi:acetyl-CoA carboxylase carboxyltransferase component